MELVQNSGITFLIVFRIAFASNEQYIRAAYIDKTKSAGVKSNCGVRNDEILEGRRREWPR